MYFEILTGIQQAEERHHDFDEFDSDGYETSNNEFTSDESDQIGEVSDSIYDAFDSDAYDSDDASMSTSHMPKPFIPASAPVGRPRAPPGSKADTRRNAQRRRRARQNRQEDLLEKDWRAAVASHDNETADELLQELLPTLRGRRLFPSLSHSLNQVKSFEKLGENVKQLNIDLGARSKHRKSIATRVTKGLPPEFCEDILAFKKSYLRKARQRESENVRKPSLLQEKRDEQTKRVRWGATYVEEIVKFFESRTEILSGANTLTRRLLINKGRLEAEFCAEYPAILRKIVRRDPSIRPDPNSGLILTTLQQNVLAAEYAANQPDFSQAEEYQERLNNELQR